MLRDDLYPCSLPAVFDNEAIRIEESKMKQDLAFPRFSRQTGFLHEESLFSDLCLSQRRKGAKRYRVFKGFLCAFASLRETVFPQMYFSCKASQTLIRPSLLLCNSRRKACSLSKIGRAHV